MRHRILAAAAPAAVACLAAAIGIGAATSAGPGAATPTSPATAAGYAFSDPTTIDNPYLPLTTHRRCVLAGEIDGVRERSVRTRLDRTETFRIDGAAVPAVVIEDRAFHDGRLVERTLDYFVQADDGTVLYLGEDVDDIENGRVVGHAGAWRLGRDTTVAGVAMPPSPRVGDTWRFEDVPPITVEDDYVTAHFPFVEAGGRVHPDVIRVREDLSPDGVSDTKLYAPGVGEIRSVPWTLEGSMDLVRCT